MFNYINIIYFFWNWVIFKINKYFFINYNKNKINPSPKTNEQIFIENETKLFLSTFNDSSNLYNKSIDLIFYDIEKYNILMTTENELEKKWKSNILFVYTPRGNVIMFYNCYKRGFSYYCDSQVMSYELLNIIAMKYVRMYLCRDLYIDNRYTESNGQESPLISLINIFDKKEKEKENENNKNENPKNKIYKTNNSSFVKFKKYNIVLPTSVNKITLNKSTNNFIYLGKICNFKFLQKPKIESKKKTYKEYLLEKDKKKLEINYSSIFV
jgi:hypothetical protein